MDKTKEKEKEPEIEFVDRRRIKSADDTCDDAPEADLERVPTAMDKMRDELAQADLRLKDYISAYKDRVAELDRTRKRLEDESAARAEAKFADLAGELFPVMDDLDRATDAARGQGSEGLLAGLEMVRNRFFGALSRHGMEMIDCLNKPFDPELAQAVAVEAVEDEALDNMVVEQLAPGYRLGSRVLRQALVKVGHRKEED